MSEPNTEWDNVPASRVLPAWREQVRKLSLEINELRDKNQTLKSEVERLTAKQTDIDRVQAQSDFYRSKLMNQTEYNVNVQLIDQVKHLEAQVERLTKAGDDMAVWITIIGNSLTCWQIEEWLRAKKGLPSEKEQREKQIKAAAKDGKDVQ